MLIPRYLALILNPAQSLAAGFTLLCIKKKEKKRKKFIVYHFLYTSLLTNILLVAFCFCFVSVVLWSRLYYF